MFKGLIQYWSGYLTVQAYSSRVFVEQKWKLTARGTKKFKKLYPVASRTRTSKIGRRKSLVIWAPSTYSIGLSQGVIVLTENQYP